MVNDDRVLVSLDEVSLYASSKMNRENESYPIMKLDIHSAGLVLPQELKFNPILDVTAKRFEGKKGKGYIVKRCEIIESTSRKGKEYLKTEIDVELKNGNITTLVEFLDPVIMDYLSPIADVSKS